MSGRLLLCMLLTCGAALSGCGGDDDEGGGDGVVRVSEVGAAFTYRDLAVAQGWRLRPIERAAGINETMTSPEVKARVTNEGEAPAYALFEIVFAKGSTPVSTLKCSSPQIAAGESAALLCPGLGQPMPEDYDQIVVQEITR